MRGWILELLINAIAVAVITSGLLPGVRIIGNQLPTVIVVALAFAVANVLIKPILKLLTCPLIFLTLGLIILVIDGAMLALAASFSDVTGTLTGGRLVIDSFGWAVVGALIMGIIEGVLGWVLDRQERRAKPPVRTTRVILEDRRSGADDFNSLMRGERSRRHGTPAAENDWDFYDPDTGKPKRR
ncbi:MAG: phage holin family protein [Anaerolineae bacterium]|nr:phage holin family protein [Anaerolineae bacterium]NUQ06300.1 phage holin family protein [Anaerolineae bacterium]